MSVLFWCAHRKREYAASVKGGQPQLVSEGKGDGFGEGLVNENGT